MSGTGNLASYSSVQEAQTLGGSATATSLKRLSPAFSESLPLYSQLMEVPTLIQETSCDRWRSLHKTYEMQRKWILVESCPT